ncbi:Hypothetical protein DSVG11_1619 [Desulfovibrio sp. G11]|nr:Hypothetical protein DSVG11_1619 [Desulfovibrio sp. G11]
MVRGFGLLAVAAMDWAACQCCAASSPLARICHGCHVYCCKRYAGMQETRDKTRVSHSADCPACEIYGRVPPWTAIRAFCP